MSRPLCKDCGLVPARKNVVLKGKQYYHKTCNSCNDRLNHPYRKYKKEKCDFCGFIPVHRCQLDIDHIDGNHDNNELENLQTLCANCHRLKTFLNAQSAGYK